MDGVTQHDAPSEQRHLRGDGSEAHRGGESGGGGGAEPAALAALAVAAGAAPGTDTQPSQQQLSSQQHPPTAAGGDRGVESGGGGGGGGGGGAPVIVVLAATNRPWDLDDALRRRLEKRIYIPLPDARARAALFDLQLRAVTLAGDVDPAALAARTARYSGADIASVCRDAALASVRRALDGARARGLDARALQASRRRVLFLFLLLGCLPCASGVWHLQRTAGINKWAAPLQAELRALDEAGSLRHAAVGRDDFERALANVSPSVDGADHERYERWMGDFGSA